MSGPSGNQLVLFSLKSFYFVEGNIRTLGKTKLTVSLGIWHEVYIIIHIKECINRPPLWKRSIIHVRVTKKNTTYQGLSWTPSHFLKNIIIVVWKYYHPILFYNHITYPVKGVWWQSSNWCLDRRCRQMKPSLISGTTSTTVILVTFKSTRHLWNRSTPQRQVSFYFLPFSLSKQAN